MPKKDNNGKGNNGKDNNGTDSLDDELQQRLIQASINAMKMAYAPYSNFSVGASILSEDGTIHVGCNVENAAYPVGNCAEAGAISAMVQAGQRHIIAIAVSGAGKELCTPCGACRQRIHEFAQSNTDILICDVSGLRHETTLGELLPLSFGSDNLE